MLPEVVKERSVKGAIERGLAGPYTIQQLGAGIVSDRLAHDQDPRTHGARNAGAQTFGQGCEPEASRGILGEDALAGQRAEQAVERACVRARGLGEVQRRAWTLNQ